LATDFLLPLNLVQGGGESSCVCLVLPNSSSVILSC